MATINLQPSIRAAGRFHALVPDGWTMDEWRGGNCAALTRAVDIDGTKWELVILPDDDLSLPTQTDPGTTWNVYANTYDDNADGQRVICDAIGRETALVIPAPNVGDDFDTDAVEKWATEQVTSGNTTVV